MGNEGSKGKKGGGAETPKAGKSPQATGGADGKTEAKQSEPQVAGQETGGAMNDHLKVEDFELLQVVGKGSFGKVMQVKYKATGGIYAMKVLKKDELVKRKQVAHTKTERKVLQTIDHPFIVSLRFAFQSDTKLYMILDYFSGGELFFHLKRNGRFDCERAKFYAAEITLGLGCLHANDIVYRDLKPENILLDDAGHIRLTDFGLSKDTVGGDQLTHTFCGTPEYLAPEVIHGGGYGQAVDWWSLGTLLYEMLTGLPPFFNRNLHVMYEKIVRGRLTFPSYLTNDAKAILTVLLHRTPEKRLGSGPEDAKEIQKHPFFSNINWDDLYARKVEPPFKPTITDGATDVTNVDDEFKNEKPQDTPCAPSTLRSKVNFADFTFANTSEQLAEAEAKF